MNPMHPSRRQFMAMLTGAAMLAFVPGCSLARRLDPAESRALLRMARLLFPHDALPDEVYADVLQPLQAEAQASAELDREIRAGLDRLDQASGGSWLALPQDRQVAALTALQDEAFFQTVHTGVRNRLYEHPQVWKLIGYEGSSVEYGGYLHRGFDDIDWLPEN